MKKHKQLDPLFNSLYTQLDNKASIQLSSGLMHHTSRHLFNYLIQQLYDQLTLAVKNEIKAES